MTTIDDAIARVSAVLDELRESRAEVSAAAVNADGSPGNVAAGELIESAWGNATANTIGKLKNASRYTAVLSMAPQTVDTAGSFISGNLGIPAAAYRRVAVVTINVLLTSTSEVDLVLYAAGAVIMRRARHPAVGGNGVTVKITTQTVIPANVAEQFAAKLAAVVGTTQVNVPGGAEYNYLDVVTIPTLVP